jgi:hypothetical protein
LRADRLIAAALVVALLAGAGPAGPSRPVMVGGTADYDACPSTFTVTGLNPRGDNFLSLRSAPSADARELARLKPGQVVWACDETGDGNWTGVLVSPDHDNVDCGVGTPIARRQPYRGPCKAGWAASRYLTSLAG